MARKASKTNVKTQKTSTNTDYFEKIKTEVSQNQSKLSMVLGTMIILVVGILIFNYFNKSKSDLGPAQQTQQQQDVTADNLPGKYTVKAGDTLFIIAEKYYSDGLAYDAIAKANNLVNPDSLEEGQVLEIPKLEESTSLPPTPEATPSATPSAAPVQTEPEPAAIITTDQNTDSAQWGPKILGSTYTVVEGDWLSTIAGRAYGDVLAYQKIAQANKIENPDLIIPGTVLTIPR